MPSQQHTPAHIAPLWQRHALVEVLHQGILRVRRQRLHNSRDVRRLRAVQYRHKGLQVKILQIGGRVRIRSYSENPGSYAEGEEVGYTPSPPQHSGRMVHSPAPA